MNEFNFWSPILGCDAVRLSLCNEDGAEYFKILPKTDGARWRLDKEEAQSAIREAIYAGAEPGEVA